MKNTNKYFSKVILAVTMFASVQAVQAAEPASKKQVEDVLKMLDYMTQQLRIIMNGINDLKRG